MFTEYDYEAYLLSVDGLFWKMNESARETTAKIRAILDAFDAAVAAIVVEQMDRDIMKEEE